jgi:putative sugar O-methyltransferase
MVMNRNKLTDLLEEYRNQPQEFQATSYWSSYESRILDTVNSLDFTQLRSGKYPILATFGFNDVKYTVHPNLPLWKKTFLKFYRYLIKDWAVLPYSLKTADIQEMAYHHCQLMADLTNSIPLSTVEVSTFGNPQDIFEMNGRSYTLSFLHYYLRYCFAQKHISFKGDEIIVELGSGSGYQIEVLKKIYPNITVLCFDLPVQLYLCETYLTQALGTENIVGSDVTLKWKELSGIKKGGIHFLGNWLIPLLQDFQLDVFWNAVSFGEMEPAIVENYLNYVKNNAKWVYLLQARHGKETSGRTHVQDPTTFDDYKRFLSGYVLQEEHNAWLSHRRLSQSGGYFEGVWRKA